MIAKKTMTFQNNTANMIGLDLENDGNLIFSYEKSNLVMASEI